MTTGDSLTVKKPVTASTSRAKTQTKKTNQTTAHKTNKPAQKTSTQKPKVNQAGFSFSLPSLKEIGRQQANESMERAVKQKKEITEMERKLKAEPNWLKKGLIILGALFSPNNTSPHTYASSLDNYSSY